MINSPLNGVYIVIYIYLNQSLGTVQTNLSKKETTELLAFTTSEANSNLMTVKDLSKYKSIFLGSCMAGNTQSNITGYNSLTYLPIELFKTVQTPSSNGLFAWCKKNNNTSVYLATSNSSYPAVLYGVY